MSKYEYIFFLHHLNLLDSFAIERSKEYRKYVSRESLIFDAFFFDCTADDVYIAHINNSN